MFFDSECDLEEKNKTTENIPLLIPGVHIIQKTTKSVELLDMSIYSNINYQKLNNIQALPVQHPMQILQDQLDKKIKDLCSNFVTKYLNTIDVDVNELSVDGFALTSDATDYLIPKFNVPGVQQYHRLTPSTHEVYYSEKTHIVSEYLENYMRRVMQNVINLNQQKNTMIQNVYNINMNSFENKGSNIEELMANELPEIAKKELCSLGITDFLYFEDIATFWAIFERQEFVKNAFCSGKYYYILKGSIYIKYTFFECKKLLNDCAVLLIQYAHNICVTYTKNILLLSVIKRLLNKVQKSYFTDMLEIYFRQLVSEPNYEQYNYITNRESLCFENVCYYATEKKIGEIKAVNKVTQFIPRVYIQPSDSTRAYKFFSSIFPNSNTLGWFLKELCKRILTKVNNSKVWFLLGSGANGKSVLAQVLYASLSPFVGTLSSSFLTPYKGDGSTATPQYSQLEGLRVAIVSEVLKNSIDSEILKTISGVTGWYQEDCILEFMTAVLLIPILLFAVMAFRNSQP